jgi:hypothetical protein
MKRRTFIAPLASAAATSSIRAAAVHAQPALSVRFP